MVRRSGSASARARRAPRRPRRPPWAPAGRGRSRRRTSSSASTRAAAPHFARASPAPPKISSGPSRRSSEIPSGLQNRRSARARSSGGAAAATFSAASARRSWTRPSWSGALLVTTGSSSVADAVEQQPGAGGRHAAPAALEGRDRLVLDDLDAQVVREVGPHAQRRRPRRTARPRRAAPASSTRSVLIPVAAVSSACAHLRLLGAGAAGDRHALDGGERRVAEPQPPEREPGDRQEHAREHAPGQPLNTRHGCGVRRRAPGSYPRAWSPPALRRARDERQRRASRGRVGRAGNVRRRPAGTPRRTLTAICARSVRHPPVRGARRTLPSLPGPRSMPGRRRTPRQPTSARPSASTSPAPSVSTRSPSRSRPRR